MYAVEIGTTTVIGEGVEVPRDSSSARPNTEPSECFSWAGDTLSSPL